MHLTRGPIDGHGLNRALRIHLKLRNEADSLDGALDAYGDAVQRAFSYVTPEVYYLTFLFHVLPLNGSVTELEYMHEVYLKDPPKFRSIPEVNEFVIAQPGARRIYDHLRKRLADTKQRPQTNPRRSPGNPNPNQPATPATTNTTNLNGSAGPFRPTRSDTRPMVAAVVPTTLEDNDFFP